MHATKPSLAHVQIIVVVSCTTRTLWKMIMED
jgi:hypothetical protein